MIRLMTVFVLLLVSACKEEAAQDTTPIPLTAEAIGHFCQMNILEHDGPKAQAHLAGLPGMPLFFSQVRDVVAYTRLPEQSHEILAVWVNDMGAPDATWTAPGAANWIAASQAYYVVGAQVVGGMGTSEIVPFARAEHAASFVGNNGGAVMRLADIPDEAVLAPVEFSGDRDDTDFENRLRALSRKPEG